MSATERKAELTMPVAMDRDHVRGAADATVTLVEYGDYGCLYCGTVEPIMKAAQARMGERLCFVYRHFPITALCRYAKQAAEAAEAAAAQGQFWQMHELLYQNQPHIADQDLYAYAHMVGLDLEPFDRDLVEHVHAARVREDFMSGVRSGVNSTPTVFINSVRHDGSLDIDTLLTALERAATSE